MATSELGATLLLITLAEALFATRGHYKTNRLLFIVVAFSAFAALQKHRGRAACGGQVSLALLSCFGAALLCVDARLLYPTHASWLSWVKAGHAAALLLVGLTLVLALRPIARRAFLPAVMAAAACFLFARVAVILACPEPHIDVFSTVRLAAEHLLAGQNPYSVNYPDIYGGIYDYRPGLVYWPGTLLSATLGQALFRDVRAAYLLADGFALVALVRAAARLGHGARVQALAILAWLAFPIGPFVLEQGFVDPLLSSALAWATVFLLERRLFAFGVALGLAASVKQYGALAGVLGVLLVALSRPLSLDRARPVVLGGLLGFGAVMLPFVLWDGPGLYTMTVAVPLGQALRTDALTLPALLFREFGRTLPGPLVAALLMMTLALLTRSLARSPLSRGARQWPAALTLLYGVTFILGKQAFANYYDLAARLAFLALLASSVPAGGSEAMRGRSEAFKSTC